MCNIAHVKTIKSINFLLKNNNYLLKCYIFNVNAQALLQIYYFKFLKVW